MSSYRTPKAIDLRPTDVVRIVIPGNPKRAGGKNVAYYDAIASAIAAGHTTVAGIVAATKKDRLPDTTRNQAQPRPRLLRPRTERRRGR